MGKIPSTAKDGESILSLKQMIGQTGKMAGNNENAAGRPLKRYEWSNEMCYRTKKSKKNTKGRIVDSLSCDL
jgi:hypothetical protein